MSSVEASDPLAVAIVESALIFETKHGGPDTLESWHTHFDRIVVVTAPEALRRRRYRSHVSGKRNELDPNAASADFDRRSAAQWPEEQKAALADYVVRNGASVDQLRLFVHPLYVKLRRESADRAAAGI